MKIFVKTLTGAQFDINVELSNTVGEVKKNIEATKGAATFPADRMKLIHAGSVLKDDATLDSCKVKEVLPRASLPVHFAVCFLLHAHYALCYYPLSRCSLFT